MNRIPRPHRVLALLAAWHLLLAIAAWLAPHPPSFQHRSFPDAPPSRIRWFGAQGEPAWPHVCSITSDANQFGQYLEDCSQRSPLRLWHTRPDGHLALVGVNAPAVLFLLGTDEFGRDVFSRTLAGGLISMGAGLAAAIIALLIASVLGGLAGFFGGFVDSLISRTSEFLLALPFLYLLLVMRAALPIQTPPLNAFFMAVLAVSLVGWARPARLVRGMVLSARERGFVLAASGFGASPTYLLRKHILPQTYSVLLVQAALLVPQFVLLEVTLSFFGLGVPEPTASWGTMLSSLRQYPILASNWWMFSPAMALLVSLFLFGAYAQTLDHAGRN